jgi:PKD repeat protein
MSIRFIIGTVGVASCVWLTSAVPARAQGAATSVSVAPQTITAGGTVSVTAKGTNPCGAVRINYGDGDAITYALTALPTSQTHVYQKPGTYTITAEGMGNCAGAPTTTVTVSAPPTPAVPSAVIQAVEITPAPARVQDPVAIIVRGSGTCSYAVEYGDGTSEQVNARLPDDSHHTYGKPGRYVVIVRPVAPCAGKFTEVLQVEDAPSQPPGNVTHVLVSPSPAGRSTTIAVHGTGACAYDIYYGDGATEEVNGALPRSTEHVYQREGRYVAVVKPQPPCTGKFTEIVQVPDEQRPWSSSARGPRVFRVTAAPSPAIARQPVRITVAGTGTCSFTVDYGDGNADSRSMTLPASVRHTYSAPDLYTVTVTPDDRDCSGSGEVSIEVRRYLP